MVVYIVLAAYHVPDRRPELFNAVVVDLGALLLGVPLAGTIAVVTFLAAYVLYLGAWSGVPFRS